MPGGAYICSLSLMWSVMAGWGPPGRLYCFSLMLINKKVCLGFKEVFRKKAKNMPYIAVRQNNRVV